jgi:hypothetical protein
LRVVTESRHLSYHPVGIWGLLRGTSSNGMSFVFIVTRLGEISSFGKNHPKLISSRYVHKYMYQKCYMCYTFLVKSSTIRKILILGKNTSGLSVIFGEFLVIFTKHNWSHWIGRIVQGKNQIKIFTNRGISYWLFRRRYRKQIKTLHFKNTYTFKINPHLSCMYKCRCTSAFERLTRDRCLNINCVEISFFSQNTCSSCQNCIITFFKGQCFRRK